MTQADHGTIKSERFPRQANQSMMQKMSKGKFTKEVNQFFRSTPEKKLIRGAEFICELCKKEFVDPRVLPCLHCFCVQCLQKLDLEQNPRTATGKRSRNERFQGILADYFSKDSSSSEYFRLNPISAGAEEKDESIYNRRKGRHPTLTCPTCGFDNLIPDQGVFEFPPHYLLQHRMLIKCLNRGEICLLCDLCPSEIPATSRCTRCLLNLCSHCSKTHKREKLFPDHELMKLKKNQEGIGITRIRRQAMCHAHPDKELKLYCSSCNQVTCTDCRAEFHSGHNCESSSRAAQVYTCKIKESLERTRSLNKDTSATMNRLNVLSQQIESKYSQVQKEINSYIDCYVEALEEHRKCLLKQAGQIKNAQIQKIKARKKEVEKKALDIGHTLRFGEELLTEGSDFEVLSFALYVLQRLEWCIKSGSSALSSALTSCIGTLQFLPEERAGTLKNHPVYGIVTTQPSLVLLYNVASHSCKVAFACKGDVVEMNVTAFKRFAWTKLQPEVEAGVKVGKASYRKLGFHAGVPSQKSEILSGVNALRNCKENDRCEVTLVTTDGNDQRLTHGAEGIEVELRSKNGPQRQIPIFIVDRQNGVYDISFTPNVPGKMTLSVSIRGISIQGSPFLVCVRSKRVHKGVFHCCAFCSSGGSKSAICGCKGTMPGGYQGCGHGYSGHPGRRHWSCCGNTLHKSECLRSLRSDGFYQLSL